MFIAVFSDFGEPRGLDLAGPGQDAPDDRAGESRRAAEKQFVIFAVAQGVGQTGSGAQGNGGNVDLQIDPDRV